MKYVTVSAFSPSICHEVMGRDTMILIFCMLSSKPAFSLFHLHQEPLDEMKYGEGNLTHRSQVSLAKVAGADMGTCCCFP